MAGTLAAGGRKRAVRAAAELVFARSWGERLIGVLHLMASLVLSALYLLPAAMLAVAAAWIVLRAAGLVRKISERVAQDLAVTLPLGDLVIEGLIFLVLFPPLATLIARLSCAIQRHRLESVFGVTGPGAPVLEMLSTSTGRFRVLGFLFGRDAWTAVVYSTAAGLQGLFSGGITIGLVVYGIAVSIGSFLGLGYLVIDGAAADIARLVTVIVGGLLAAFVGFLLVPLLVGLEVEVARRLLLDGADVRVRRRLLEVQDSRLRMVDAAEAERRRIERDLHDGAQQQLLAVTMTLARARARFDRDPEQARSLLDQAQAEAKEVMAELREVARGLHPRVLTDHGLEAALPVAAGRCPVPVRVDVDLPDRPSRRAEGIGYYVVCEALTNVAKHAAADNVAVRAERVRGNRRDDLLRLTVTDDGAGGAEPDAGTGLYGLWDRVNAVDGALRVHSPVGEGTVLTADIPWEA
ncbi:two-component sensor histidine kinase [Nocardiopsis gilva YIM 90087]|uniref:histidine kinase n=2 Tax=Nocardiopsis gilva TaxID=280236 RepID=A0A223S2L3_9ACTN|nr:histidine kinase [Nocardiopsis gilva]ASU82364.1 two-component sensor histidine kinase [Nocardiopsis gilva YIM 90087]